MSGVATTGDSLVTTLTAAGRHVVTLSTAELAVNPDVDAALPTMGEVGASLRRDPVLGLRILADMEVLGVEDLKESGLQLRGRIKTRPGAASAVTREFNRRIKAAFDEKAMTISSPHMRLVCRKALSPAKP